MNTIATNIAEQAQQTVVPAEGWHVVHLFYHVDHAQWSMLSSEEKLEAKTNFSKLLQEVRAYEDTQVLTFGMVTPKSDVGVMILTADLHVANEIEKRITLGLGPEILTPTFSYLSMTEKSEYTTTAEQYGETLTAERKMEKGSDEYVAALEEFDSRIKKYTTDRLYPNMPDWPVFCFYPMSKRRSGDDNWYSLDFDARKKLMAGHAAIGRTWAGKIRQLITGSTGLDEHEWGVTLFAHDTQNIKEIVYEMRFDEVSARYAEFGDFFIGLQLPLDVLFRRVNL